MLDSSEILALYSPLLEIEEIHWVTNVIISKEEAIAEIIQTPRSRPEINASF